jgi:hypothetical protein
MDSFVNILYKSSFGDFLLEVSKSATIEKIKSGITPFVWKMGFGASGA